jgi:hypothetical protein
MANVDPRTRAIVEGVAAAFDALGPIVTLPAHLSGSWNRWRTPVFPFRPPVYVYVVRTGMTGDFGAIAGDLGKVRRDARAALRKTMQTRTARP